MSGLQDRIRANKDKDSGTVENAAAAPTTAASRRLNSVLENAQSYQDQTSTAMEALEGEKVVRLHCTDIDPNPFQHRTKFDAESIGKLRTSIQQNGQNQAIGVRKVGNRYQIIFGERRWRAVSGTDEKIIDAVIRDLNDVEMRYICLSENNDREKPFDFERWRGLKSVEEAARPREEILLRMNLDIKEYYKLKTYGELPADVLEFLHENPSALQRNEAADVAKVFKDTAGSGRPTDGMSKRLIELMGGYLGGTITNRGDIVKKFKSEYAVVKQRNREKVNHEFSLSFGGAKVGSLVQAQNEVRLTVSKSDLPKDKLDELEDFMKKFFDVSPV